MLNTKMTENNNLFDESNIAGVKGEYLIEVIKPNGTTEFPFGIEKRKNLILDTFFRSILEGYKFGIQSFIQACRVGDGTAPAQRTDTGLKGNLIDQTYKSDNFIASINSTNNSISLTRDFTFNTVTVADITYSECIIGSFAINNISEILTSRFVFPGELTLLNGDRLKITYTLTLFIPYLNSDVPITLSGKGLNFNGAVRLSSNTTGIISQISGDNTYITLGDSDTTIFKSFKIDTNSFNQTQEFTNYGRYQNIFGTALWANNIGFYPSGTHTPTNYPEGRLDYTPLGPKAVVSTGNFQQANSGSSIDINYYFPEHPSDRYVGGIYLWHYNTGSSYSAIYYKFNNPQMISGNIPVSINLRWSFTRI